MGNSLRGYDAPTLGYIYDMLVKHAGARDEEDERQAFVQYGLGWNETRSMEYRFMGSLGFGGKIWLCDSRGPYINCYREDETPERQETIDRTNRELKRLMEEVGWKPVL